jgi:Ca2+-binding RTX toxin-like protein
MGRDDDDLIEGGDDKDIMRGDRGEDKLYADSEIALAEAIAGQGGTPTNEKGDWLDGGEDDDILIGGTGNDALIVYALRDIYVAFATSYPAATSDPRRRGHLRSRYERPLAAACLAASILVEIGPMASTKRTSFRKGSRGGTPSNEAWKMAA